MPIWHKFRSSYLSPLEQKEIFQGMDSQRDRQIWRAKLENCIVLIHTFYDIISTVLIERIERTDCEMQAFLLTFSITHVKR